MNRNLGDLRNDYGEKSLSEKDLTLKPFELFQTWLEEAIHSDIYEPNAMVLSTIDRNLFPDSRVVLLKGIEDEKLVFFTNYASAKGQQIELNKNVSLLFFWKEFHRQIRIQGIIEKTTKKESEDYFRSRPRESQLGARASLQSNLIPDRESLEKDFLREKQEFENTEIPMPENWGGYRVSPVKFEFWQGRSGRLHDRLVYKLQEGNWIIQRLAP